MTQKIKGIHGDEPRRDREYPVSYVVGFDGITEIVESEQNFGTYGIKWFHAMIDDREIAKMNAAYVAIVQYEQK